MRRRWAVLAVIGAAIVATPGALRAQALETCTAAIAVAERAAGLPAGLLLAIGVTESGRAGPGGRVAPWPWAVNANGVGHYYASAEEALAAVQALQASGVQSIDVGCLQVNLLHHPAAFPTLQQAFAPAVNAAYAARFLVSLRAELGDWTRAVAAYHSRTPDRGGPYASRVAAAWSDGPGLALAPLARAATIDPYGVYTPEFRRRMEQQAALHPGPPAAASPRAASQPLTQQAQARHFPSQLAQRVPALASRTRIAALDSRPSGRQQ